MPLELVNTRNLKIWGDINFFRCMIFPLAWASFSVSENSVYGWVRYFVYRRTGYIMFNFNRIWATIFGQILSPTRTQLNQWRSNFYRSKTKELMLARNSSMFQVNDYQVHHKDRKFKQLSKVRDNNGYQTFYLMWICINSLYRFSFSWNRSTYS